MRLFSGPPNALGKRLEVSPLPATSWTAFALHDEGDGLWALHVSSMPQLLLAELQAALDLGNTLRDVTLAWGVQRNQPIAPKQILFLQAPCEVLHDPSASVSDGFGVIADPHGALSADRRLAFVIYDDDRAVLYSRDPEVIEQALVCWIGGVVEDLAGPLNAPELDVGAVVALHEIMPQGSWREVQLRQAGSSWICTLQGNGVTDRRWIGSCATGWRTGWEW